MLMYYLIVRKAKEEYRGGLPGDCNSLLPEKAAGEGVGMAERICRVMHTWTGP